MVDCLLVSLVAPTVREDDDGAEVQRIISARKDVPKKGKRYEQDRQLRGRPWPNLPPLTGGPAGRA